jgi:hypothetical protein
MKNDKFILLSIATMLISELGQAKDESFQERVAQLVR